MIAPVKKSLILALITAFIGSSVHLPQAYAQGIPWMPVPGVRVGLSVPFMPAHLKGMIIHQEDALRFDFLIHQGDDRLSGEVKKDEYQKLIKYFMASLTVPDDDQWVNLSPYEKNRIIEQDFSQTEMGRDLLAQDYLLKQITASLMYPEESLGKKFWDRVFTRAQEELGTTDIPLNTFNKVWIVPDRATVYEKGDTVYVLENHLKVMMEEDYLSLEKNSASRSLGTELMAKEKVNQTSNVSSRVVREIIIPELEREVNEGKNFAPLRQIYSGMILSAWYKRALKESLLGKIYADKAKTNGVNIDDPKQNEEIYQKYLAAYKKGVFNYIKEDVDKLTQQPIPRKYFSGGAYGAGAALMRGDLAMTTVSSVNQLPALQRVVLGGQLEQLVAVATQFDTRDGSVAIAQRSSNTGKQIETTFATEEAVDLTVKSGRVVLSPAVINTINAMPENLPDTFFAIKPQEPVSVRSFLERFDRVAKLRGIGLGVNEFTADTVRFIIGGIEEQIALKELMQDMRKKYGVELVYNQQDGFFIKDAAMTSNVLKAVLLVGSISLASQVEAWSQQTGNTAPIVTNTTAISYDTNKVYVLRGGTFRSQKGYFHDGKSWVQTKYTVSTIAGQGGVTTGGYTSFKPVANLPSGVVVNTNESRAILIKTKELYDNPPPSTKELLKRADKAMTVVDARGMVLDGLNDMGLGQESVKFPTNQKTVKEVRQALIALKQKPEFADAKTQEQFTDLQMRVLRAETVDLIQQAQQLSAADNAMNASGILDDASYSLIIALQGLKATYVSDGTVNKRVEDMIEHLTSQKPVTSENVQIWAPIVEDVFSRGDKGALPLKEFSSIGQIAFSNLEASTDKAMNTKELRFKLLKSQASNLVDFVKFFGPAILVSSGAVALLSIDETGRQERIANMVAQDESRDSQRIFDSLFTDAVKSLDGSRQIELPSEGPATIESKIEQLFADKMKLNSSYRETKVIAKETNTYEVNVNVLKFPRAIMEHVGPLMTLEVKVVGDKLNVSFPVKDIKSTTRDKDKVMIGDNVGGIDLNAANLNLLIKRDGNGVPLPISQQDMNLLNKIDGLVPVIIDIKPVMNLPILSELKQPSPANT